MTGHIRVGGAWKEVSSISVRVAGAWKSVDKGFTRIGGAWKEFFSATPPITPFTGNAVAGISADFVPAAFMYTHTDTSFGTKLNVGGPLTNSEDQFSIELHPQKTAIFYGVDRGNRLSAVQLTSEGAGAAFAAPASLPTGSPYRIKVHPFGNAVIITGSFGVQSYNWSASGWGTKHANPTTGITGVGRGIAIAPYGGGNGVLVASSSSPYLHSYGWNGNGMTTKYTNSTTFPTGVAYDVHINQQQGVAIAAHATSPFMSAYDVYDGAMLGSKYSNPASLPPSIGYGVSATSEYNPDVVIGHRSSPFVSAYSLFGGEGWGSRYNNPSSLPSGDGQSVRFSANSNAVFVGTRQSPVLQGYRFFGQPYGFGTKFANPAVATGTSGATFSLATI